MVSSIPPNPFLRGMTESIPLKRNQMGATDGLARMVMWAWGRRLRKAAMAGMASTQSPSQLKLTTSNLGVPSQGLLVTDSSDTGIEVLRSGQKFYVHPQKIDRKIASVKAGETDRILLGGDEGLSPAVPGTVDDLDYFLLGIAMVVGKLNPVAQARPEMLQFPFKSARHSNP